MLEMVEKMKLNLLHEFSLKHYTLCRVAILLLFQLNHSLLDRIRTLYITHYDHYKFIENFLIQSDHSLHLDRSILNRGR